MTGILGDASASQVIFFSPRSDQFNIFGSFDIDCRTYDNINDLCANLGHASLVVFSAAFLNESHLSTLTRLLSSFVQRRPLFLIVGELHSRQIPYYNQLGDYAAVTWVESRHALQLMQLFFHDRGLHNAHHEIYRSTFDKDIGAAEKIINQSLSARGMDEYGQVTHRGATKFTNDIGNGEGTDLSAEILPQTQSMVSNDRSSRCVIKRGRVTANREFRPHKPNRESLPSWANIASRHAADLGMKTNMAMMDEDRAAERILCESEALLRMIIDTMLEVFVIYTPIRNAEGNIEDFSFEYVNNAACRLAGHMVNISDLRLSAVVPGGRDNTLFQLLCDVLRSRQPMIQENFALEIYCDGTTINRIFDLRAVSNGDAIAIAWSDVTERFWAVRALEESEERLRMAAQAAGFGTYDVDLKNREVYWSPELVELVGRTATASFTTEYCHPWVHPDDEWMVRKRLQRCMSEGQEGLLQEQYRIQCPDGRIRWVLERGTVRLESIGGTHKLIRISGILLDTTEQKDSEDKLRRSTEFTQRMLESTEDCVKVLDLEGNLIFMNDAGQRALRIPHMRHVLHRYWPEFWTERKADRDEALRAIATARSGGTGHFEGYCSSWIGEPRWWDVLITPIRGADGHPEQLLSISRDITERKQMEEQLHRAAHHDRLTGLPNRSLFIERLGRARGHALRTNEYYAVFVLDLDNFKLINDSLGHLAGDELLCEFARRIQQVLGPLDMMARFGGDEFTVLMENVIHYDAVVDVARRIMAAVKAPFVLQDHVVQAATSIGITVDHGDYEHPDHALRDADIALYEAKRRGKGGYCFFNAAMRHELMTRLHIESELGPALELEKLDVYYQPISDLCSARVVGCEALSRWCHPTIGAVEPSHFINIAEETGLIIPLGRFVIEMACRTLARWIQDDNVPRDFYVSVNLSPKEFLQSDLVSFISRILDKYDLNGRNLRLEITENVILKFEKDAASTLKALQAVGVLVCMDDFGTGYSSLSYLHQFPIDVLKVDRSFVTQLDRKECQEILRTILCLSDALDIEAIAEGAETDGQLRRLREIGFRWAQGFALHRPLDSEAMAVLLSDSKRRVDGLSQPC